MATATEVFVVLPGLASTHLAARCMQNTLRKCVPHVQGLLSHDAPVRLQTQVYPFRTQSYHQYPQQRPHMQQRPQMPHVIPARSSTSPQPVQQKSSCIRPLSKPVTTQNTNPYLCLSSCLRTTAAKLSWPAWEGMALLAAQVVWSSKLLPPCLSLLVLAWS